MKQDKINELISHATQFDGYEPVAYRPPLKYEYIEVLGSIGICGRAGILESYVIYHNKQGAK